MKIEKLPSGSYRVRKMIDGQKISLTFDKRPTQNDIRDAIALKLKEKVTMANAPTTDFESCAKRYLEIKSNVLSASTKRGYESIIKNIAPEILQCPLKEIDQTMLQQYINDMSKDHAPKTVKERNSFIQAVIHTFIPTAQYNITLPKARKKNPDDVYIPTREDITRILEASSEKYRLVFTLSGYGLRRSEILALTLDDIKDDYIKVTKAYVQGPNKEWFLQEYNKTYDSNRNVPVDPTLNLRKRFKKQGFIFDSSPGKIYNYLIRKQKQLGIPHFRLHDFRHYFATELHQAGFADKDIQYVGGWKGNNILKTVYEHERIKNDEDIRKRAAETISIAMKDLS